jgi:hypothetical protein
VSLTKSCKAEVTRVQRIGYELLVRHNGEAEMRGRPAKLRNCFPRGLGMDERRRKGSCDKDAFRICTNTGGSEVKRMRCVKMKRSLCGSRNLCELR